MAGSDACSRSLRDIARVGIIAAATATEDDISLMRGKLVR